MPQKRILPLVSVVCLATILIAQKLPPNLTTQQDKLKQTLTVAKDPPLVAIGETSRLEFHVSPLSGQGLLSQQTRDALKNILKLNGGEPIIHIRAFSAGNGDVRRIPQIVSDVLADRHWPLPSVSVIQAGALTLDDAQIVLETISLSKKDVNKDGLSFHPAEAVVATEPESPVKLLLQKSLDQLAAKMTGAPLSVTCYVSDLSNSADLLNMLKARFSAAAMNLVQPRRLPWQTEAACEGVSRGGPAPPRMAFTGTQIAFGMEEKDAVLAVQRLERALSEAGAPHTAQATLARFYALSPNSAALALKQVEGLASKTAIPVEGVGSAAAGFSMDAVASVR